ncbi:MAG: 2-polyprenyl-3-methyl-6-methoxy-1,4-benzoquinone monooxygenase [Methylophilaceae bacterium]|uniref:2-polyprenyl-3-methyl-6-methoxy-1,4-benzoquinone monooxygenase n=1 Tax=Methylobacillus sp. MM3 TaxID=1848039 RepID=UPI0007E194B9|nr:2-polyprenyl-3-methyl-6-methoxy-1,4-benzoquinone monooxygenase [Methylobacillus sp. MM3]OAJ69476.1 2-octaprenyl-3-methyl-6-methoxy-1,4-benzoquinol hydroxylase [Methylobacillus sp. MM3]
MNLIDRFIAEFDQGLRTVLAEAQTLRPFPDRDKSESQLSDSEKRRAAALMRINHSGEVCAQALYNGQALTARNPATEAALREASQEETEHLAWCEKRIRELGSHKSFLNPMFYAGSFALGAFAGALGDKWNLGFLAETENQVGKHIEGHLKRLPDQDEKSRAILEQMKIDEARHATTAITHGGAPLPLPVKLAMELSSKIMTKTTYWI